MKKRKLYVFEVKTKTKGKVKHLGGAIAMNKLNALKQVKKIWKGHPYAKKMYIGKRLK